MMFQFGKIIPSGMKADRGQYNPIEGQDEDGLLSGDKASSEDGLNKLRKKLWIFQISFYITVVIQTLVFVYWILHGHAQAQPHATYRDLEWSGLLGEDWNKLVPNGKQFLKVYLNLSIGIANKVTL